MRSAIRTWKWASARQAPLLAAGVAFYAFTSIFPALIAGILGYGLLASPETVAAQVTKLQEVLPDDAASLVIGQLDEVTATSSQSLGIGLVIAILVALWSASGGIGNLIKAMNVMFGYTENRGFVRVKGLALLLTLGAIVFMLAMLVIVAAAPAALDLIVDNAITRAAIEALRWAALVIGLLVALNVFYRMGPAHSDDSIPQIRNGVFVGAVIWLLVSLGFSLYVDNFGSYGKTYGALAGVIILLLWLWLGALAVLLGAASARDRTLDDREPIGAQADDANGINQADDGTEYGADGGAEFAAESRAANLQQDPTRQW